VRVSSGTRTCVAPTHDGILLASTLRDVKCDVPGSTGEDSELDDIIQIFDLERLDFDDEDGLEELVE
jgi:hypothetical protein